MDFNYRYFSLKAKKKLPEQLTLILSDDYSLSCKAALQRRTRDPEAGLLYEIEDWEKLTADKTLEETVFALFGIPMDKSEVQDAQ